MGCVTDQIEVERLKNGLKWIEHIATVHWYGQAFEPHHMHALAQLASQLCDGKELPDFDTRMRAAMERGQQISEDMGKHSE
jgi:hypothetical protein